MANLFTLLAYLKAGQCSNTSHSTLIQGNVNDNRIKGSVYSLSTCLSGAHVLFDSVKVRCLWKLRIRLSKLLSSSGSTITTSCCR
ncbi:unnamed protein product [Brassica rapa subsp. narinosa]